MAPAALGVFKPADESDLGEWSMSTPTTGCAAVTSSGSGASSPARVVAGTGLGLLVDDVAGTSPAFTLVGIFLGHRASVPSASGSGSVPALRG